MNNTIWMMSNRQPWVEALLTGRINVKSRSLNVTLPPPGSIVFLHASKALWHDWKYLKWTDGLDVKNLPRGCVCGVAKCIWTGPMWEAPLELLTDEVYKWFDLYRFIGQQDEEIWTNCLDDQLIFFDNIQSTPFIPCRGALVPTRKLPEELKKYIQNNPRIERL